MGSDGRHGARGLPRVGLHRQPATVITIVLVLLVAVASPAAPWKQDEASVARRVVPSAAECRIAPRSLQSVLALSVLAHPHMPSPPGLTAPAGPTGFERPATRETVAAIADTVREETACLNAGDVLRRLALYTHDGIARYAVRYGPFPGTASSTLQSTPAPAPLEQPVALLDVRDARVLADGRVRATVVRDAPADPRADEPVVVVFVERGDRWLIDDIDLVTTRGTPTTWCAWSMTSLCPRRRPGAVVRRSPTISFS